MRALENLLLGHSAKIDTADPGQTGIVGAKAAGVKGLVGEFGAIVCGAGHGESVGDLGVMLNRAGAEVTVYVRQLSATPYCWTPDILRIRSLG